MKKLSILIIWAFIVLGCNPTDSAKQTPETSTTEEEVTQTTAPFTANQGTLGTLKINRIYATSTSLPHDTYTVHNLFDKDTKSIWKTMKGSGPEEGIMIYFETPKNIDKVVLLDSEGKPFHDYVIYADGGVFYGDQTVSNLFIKADGKFNTSLVEKEGYSTRIFPRDASFTLSEIQFFKGDDTPYKVQLPIQIKATVTASSNLKPDIAYAAANVVDSKRESAWAEAAEGTGVGEQLSFTFKQDIDVSLLTLWNGYQRSQEHHKANASVKKFTLTDAQGQKQAYTVAAKNNKQHIKLNPLLKGKKIDLSIEEVHLGTKYEDLVISEIQFSNALHTYQLNTGIEQKRVVNNLKTANELLKKVLDRNVNVATSVEETEGDVSRSFYKKSSLLLRSNNTFVLYEKEVESFYQETTEEVSADDEEEPFDDVVDETNHEIIADGNWELKFMQDDEVKIRIFGKKYTPRGDKEIYTGEDNSESLEILQDFITITPQYLQGQNVVSKIMLDE